MDIQCERKELTEWVTLFAPTETPDGQGGVTVTWAAVSGMPCGARIRFLRAAEKAEAGVVAGQVQYHVTIRAREVNESMRMQWNGKYYNVRPSMALTSRARWVSFYAESGVAI